MTQFVYITTSTSILIMFLAIGTIVVLAGLIKKDTSAALRRGLAWAIPLLVVSVFDVVICVIIITLLPGTPADISATDGTYRDKIVVTWKPVPEARTYHVLRASAPDGAYVEIAGNISETSFIDTSIKPGRYYYKVVASNDVGRSMDSKPDPGNRAISDSEFYRIYNMTAKSGIAKLKKLGKLGDETEPGSVSGTVSYSAKFDGRAHVISTFANYSDFSADQAEYLVLDGTMNTETSAFGNGTMAGRVNVNGNYSGYVKYNLVIGNRDKAGGNFLVSQDGGKTETSIPWNFQ